MQQGSTLRFLQDDDGSEKTAVECNRWFARGCVLVQQAGDYILEVIRRAFPIELTDVTAWNPLTHQGDIFYFSLQGPCLCKLFNVRVCVELFCQPRPCPKP